VRVAELFEQFRFRLVEGAIGDPQPGEVQVRVKAVGICGSDVHYYSEGGIGDIPCVYPAVLGHEPAGEVVKTGAGVTGWSPGDRAILEPAIYCYHCEYCLTGRYNVCSNLRFLSQPGDPGFFRDLVNLPVHNLMALPQGMSYAEATVVEPLAVTVHSLQFANVAPDETVVVFGAGPIGLLTIAALKMRGVKRIWSVEPRAHRRALALAMGAQVALDQAGDPVRAILADTGGRGVDAAIDCAAKGGTIDQCFHVTRSCGRVVVTAIPSEEHVTIAFHVARRKELAFFNVRRSNHEPPEALEMMRSRPELFAPLLTHTRPLEAVEEAFRIAWKYEDGVGKMVISL
jgi:L-iditol 2-dehydrogenase